MSLLLPKRAFVEPPLVQTFGCPEFYIDGTAPLVDGDVVHIVCFVNRVVSDRVQRYEVVRCHMGRNNYERNLIGAFEKFRGEDTH